MKNPKNGAVHLVGSIALAASFAGCADDPAGQGPEPDDVEAEADKKLASRGKEFSDNAVIVAWNQIAVDAAVFNDEYGAFSNDRGMTMMHLAAHDALNAIVPVYRSYAFAPPEPREDAHPTAAVAQAAHDALVETYPNQRDTLDAELEGWLDGLPNGEPKARGVELGQECAAAIIEKRTGDGMDIPGAYTPGDAPGDYQFVPPYPFVFQPAFGESVPFGLESGAQFRPQPPPALTSATYADAYNEEQAVGASRSATRTEDQSFFAQWWYETGGLGWNRLARIVADERELSLFRSARMFALLNMALVDSYVAGWNAKQEYDFWRPYTAIRAGETDGNPATEADAAWESFLIAPPVQDYPSTHSVSGAAAAEVLTAIFHTDNVPFRMQSSTADPANPFREYDSLRAAADENAESRVMAGIHFRFTIEAGLTQGREIGPFLVSHHLRPL